MKKSTSKEKNNSKPKTKPKRKPRQDKKKLETKTLENELDDLIGKEQPIFYYGPPPAIKQMYKNSGYDKNFHPADMLEHMRNGASRSEIVAAWGITYSLFNEWLDSKPELANAYAIGRPAFDAFHKRAVRLSAYGQLTRVRENSLFFMLKNIAGFEEGGGGHEYADGQNAELEFVDDND